MGGHHRHQHVVFAGQGGVQVQGVAEGDVPPLAGKGALQVVAADPDNHTPKAQVVTALVAFAHACISPRVNLLSR